MLMKGQQKLPSALNHNTIQLFKIFLLQDKFGPKNWTKESLGKKVRGFHLLVVGEKDKRIRRCSLLFLMLCYKLSRISPT